MILYLFLNAALTLGNVETQRANETLSYIVEGNQTFSNGSMETDNVTFSLNKNETRLLEDELQSNKTSKNIIREDDEGFQQQEEMFPHRHCHEEQQRQANHVFCGSDFRQQMMEIGAENWCQLESIIGPYNLLTHCVEELSSLTGCYYPNHNVLDFFISVHSYYFHNCSGDVQPADAPQGLVVALTVAPVGLIPVLVYLVVSKTTAQVQD